MYNSFEQWLNTTLENDATKDTVALVFNLFHDGDNQWSIELVGTNSFNSSGEDWACDEAFCNRDNPFTWVENAQLNDILIEINNILKKYLINGKYAKFIQQYQGIAFGFIDGDLNILYTKQLNNRIHVTL
jgi:shikimate kinase